MQRLTNPYVLSQLKVRIWGDGELIDELDILDEESHRIKYADRKRIWEYELSGNCEVTQFSMAGSVSEMHTGS